MAFIGKFQYSSSENFKELLVAVAKSINLDPEQAVSGGSGNGTIEITHSGDSYTLTAAANGKSKSVSFKLGTEFEDVILGVAKIKCVASVDGDKLSFTSVENGKSTGARVYEATSSQLVLTITSIATPVVAKVIFNKL